MACGEHSAPSRPPRVARYHRKLRLFRWLENCTFLTHVYKSEGQSLRVSTGTILGRFSNATAVVAVWSPLSSGCQPGNKRDMVHKTGFGEISSKPASGPLEAPVNDASERPQPGASRVYERLLICGSGIFVSEIKVPFDSPEPADGVIEATIIR